MIFDPWLFITFVAIASLLPLAALRMRHMALSTWVKMGLAWVAIFAVLAFFISWIGI